jgi:phage-related protein
MWAIEFFELDSGRCPTQDFLDKCHPKDELPYISLEMDYLAEFGNKLGMPHSRILENGIYELRIKVVRKQFRFFYFFFGQSIVVLTHGFLKKSQTTPRHEIEMAEKYRNIYMSRKGFRK